MSKAKLTGMLLTITGVAVGATVLWKSVFGVPQSTDITPPPDIPNTANVATSSALAGTITSPKPAPTAPAPATSLPARFAVPSLGVNAAVQHVGVKADGAMANPSNFTDVAWYKGGTVPGEVGSAVIAGHVDNALALSGVFKNLKNLKAGDLVTVTRKDGKVLTFKVDRLVYYPYKQAPNRQIFTSSDGKAHLNLVTCAGTWIKAEKSYSQRLVVYTTLVE